MEWATLKGILLNLWPLYLATEVEGDLRIALVIVAIEAMIIWVAYERIDRREANADDPDNRVTG